MPHGHAAFSVKERGDPNLSDLGAGITLFAQPAAGRTDDVDARGCRRSCYPAANGASAAALGVPVIMAKGGKQALDAFAVVGAHGLEAAPRGATSIIAVGHGGEERLVGGCARFGLVDPG